MEEQWVQHHLRYINGKIALSLYFLGLLLLLSFNVVTKFYSTSAQACPHVAGVAALLWSHFPECTNNQIRNAMIRSAAEPPASDSKNTAGWDKYYGW